MLTYLPGKVKPYTSNVSSYLATLETQLLNWLREDPGKKRPQIQQYMWELLFTNYKYLGTW